MARLLFFGALGDVMGREKALALPAGVATAAAVIEHLAAIEPAFAAALARMKVRVAVNESIVGPEVAVGDGDEIAFLPPFSGG